MRRSWHRDDGVSDSGTHAVRWGHRRAARRLYAPSGPSYTHHQEQDTRSEEKTCHDKTRETTRTVKGSYRYGAAELKVYTRKNMLACLYVYGWVHFPAEAGLQAPSMAHLAQLLTMTRTRLIQRLGTLVSPTLAPVETALMMLPEERPAI